MPTGVYVRTPEYREKQRQAHLGKPRPKEAFAHLQGSGNPGWKGDEVGYPGLHAWVVRMRGKAREHPCAWVDATCRGPMEWANVSGDYRRDLDDFIPLCQSHHSRWDRRRNPKTHCPKGHPYDDVSIVRAKGRGPTRRCRTCRKEVDRAYYLRKREVTGDH